MSRKSKRTLRQIEAARKNGARSKGPVTPEGKAKSSQNALTHGFYSDQLVLTTESTEEFQRFRDIYVTRYQPGDAVEMDLVEEIIACRWRLRRLWAMETATIDVQVEAREESTRQNLVSIDTLAEVSIAYRDLSDTSKTLTTYRRLETSLARQAERALAQLLALQAARLEAEAAEIKSTSKPPKMEIREIKPGGSQPSSNQPLTPTGTPPLPKAA